MDIGVGLVVLVIVSFIVSTLIIQYIWNAVMPDVFGTKEISFWQTIGLLILANIFFGVKYSTSQFQ